jgi:hypothetical protein
MLAPDTHKKRCSASPIFLPEQNSPYGEASFLKRDERIDSKFAQGIFGLRAYSSADLGQSCHSLGFSAERDGGEKLTPT